MPSLPLIEINFITNNLVNIDKVNFRFAGLRETTKIVPGSKSINTDIYNLNTLYLSKEELFNSCNLTNCNTINSTLTDIQKYRFRILWRTINGS